MTGVSLSYLWYFFLFFFILSESYLFYFIKIEHYKTTKVFFVVNTKNSYNMQNTLYNKYCMLTIVILILTLKTSKVFYSPLFMLITNYILFIFLLLLLFNRYLTRLETKNLFFSYFHLIVLLISFFYFLFFTKNLILILILVEIITTLYYFFFLQFSQLNNINLIKYKNLISYYLWLSFITLILISSIIILFSFNYGTTSITEVSYFTVNKILYYILFISFTFKLGLPGFHFFKLELYKYLPINILILFSIFSLLINTFIYIYILIILQSNIINNLLIIKTIKIQLNFGISNTIILNMDIISFSLSPI